MEPYVQTVTGPVPPSAITGILHHEHLLSLTPGPWLSGGRPHEHVAPEHLTFTANAADTPYAEDQVRHAVAALSGLKELGINTVVDLSPYGVVGRDAHGDNVTLLREISERSGVHVVAGTSVYLEKFSPQWTRDANELTMTGRFHRDATTGIGETDIKAGIFGEQATSLDQITAHEEKCLRAAARAALSTGLALTTHTTHGTKALEQIAIIDEEGLPLSRVVIGHQDTHQEPGSPEHLAYVLRVAETGVNLALDTIGKQTWDLFAEPAPSQPDDGEFAKRAFHKSDHTRMRLLVELLRHGYEDQILLSQDLTGAEVYMNPGTHGQWGYSYLAASFPQIVLKDAHPAAPIPFHKLLHDNPLRLLTITPPATGVEE